MSSLATEELSDEILGVYVVTFTGSRYALVQGLMQRLPFFIIEVVVSITDACIHRLQVDDLTLGQTGGLVDHEAAIVDMGLDRLHRLSV